jgi:starch synthase
MPMNIWIATREYAEIAEAGGVKNVASSLSEALVKAGHHVTVFMPEYACSHYSRLDEYEAEYKGYEGINTVSINILKQTQSVKYGSGKMKGVDFIFVKHPSFADKEGVYVYTRHEEELNPKHKNGQGHEDCLFMDALFQKAVCAFANICPDEKSPQILHCQDATTAMIPCFIKFGLDLSRKKKNFYKNTKCVVTIHNAGPGYHHEIYKIKKAKDLTGLRRIVLRGARNPENKDLIEPFLLGAKNAFFTTVSPQYAEEIQKGLTQTQGLSKGFDSKKIQITGITNGIDYERYNPSSKKDSLLPFEYNPELMDFEGKKKLRQYFYEKYASQEKLLPNRQLPNIYQFGYLSEDCRQPVFVYQGRVVSQKGIAQLAEASRIVLKNGINAKFVFMGQGQSELENLLASVAAEFPGKALYYRGYDRFLSRLCIAQADFSIIPSEFEPCCLEDFISQIYGTIPVAHQTGGLGKIINEYNGYLYENNSPEEIAGIITSLATIYNNMGSETFNPMRSYASSYVKENYSWKSVCEDQYLPFYMSILAENHIYYKF